MKKILSVLLLVIAIATYPSSKNLANSPHYYTGTITAEVDGVVQTFNIGVTAVHKSTAGIDGLTITGLHDLAGFGVSIVISKMDGDIEAGSYTSGGNNFQVLMTYANIKTMQSYQNMPFSEDTNARVKLTSLNSSGAQGSFSGTLKLANGTGTISIYDGVFNVTF